MTRFEIRAVGIWPGELENMQGRSLPAHVRLGPVRRRWERVRSLRPMQQDALQSLAGEECRSSGEAVREWWPASGAAMTEETPDRSWWKQVYRAGMKADIDKEPRIPLAYLTDDQKEVWLEGYDR